MNWSGIQARLRNWLAAKLQSRHSNRVRPRRLKLDVLENRVLLSATLLEDINRTTLSSEPSSIIAVGTISYFLANDGIHGEGLWRTDGTGIGTRLIRAVNPKSGLVAAGSNVFFAADDGIHGVELWKSDGTPAGTVMVRDIWKGAADSSPFSLTNVGGTLFFDADDGTHGTQLWKSDGTTAGTVRVTGLGPLPDGPVPEYLTSVGGKVFFLPANRPSRGNLWVSDGTSSGTFLVKAFGTSVNLEDLTDVDGVLYFWRDNQGPNAELWKSDGTAAGTLLVRNINAGSVPARLNALTNVGGTLYFTASDATNSAELWKSDGTASGTVQILDFPVQHTSYSSSALDGMTPAGGTLYFDLVDFNNNTGAHSSLWKSNGTSAGTILVKGIAADSLTECDGELYFDSRTPGGVAQLWKSNGTTGGTSIVRAFGTQLPSTISGLTNLNGKLLRRTPTRGGTLGK
jgi:ELWxxDGT repeat protein